MLTIVRVAGLAVLLAAFSPAALAQEASETTTLRLSAYGETEAAPDKAVITLGVQTKADTAAAAMRENAARMTAVIAALRSAGLDERDIRTSNINLSPQYSYQPNQPPHLDGYQAGNDVTLTIEDLARLGTVLDAAVRAGVDQVNGVDFELKDPQRAADAARKAAVVALNDKAQVYAAATGLRILRLVDLSEGGEAQPGPVRPLVRAFAMAAAQDSSAGPPVAPGPLSVRVDVDATYALAK